MKKISRVEEIVYYPLIAIHRKSPSINLLVGSKIMDEEQDVVHLLEILPWLFISKQNVIKKLRMLLTLIKISNHKHESLIDLGKEEYRLKKWIF